jgi:hypothetical protein
VIEVTQDIVISAQPSEVFAFVCDPRHALYLVPDAFEVDEAIVKPDGLYRLRVHAKIRNGTILKVETELLETVAGERTVGVQRTVPFRMGRCESLIVHELKAVGAGTLLTTQVRFDVSPRLYGIYLALLQRDKFMLSVHRSNELLRDAIEARSPAS